ncbi:XylR N-terminal domain-containing protein [Mesobacterium pallidum]|uniref:XylR N-terminal domain-containing protein n=1 Tax=Mesobacterium pallidum TaxID=2872037 RepID=UPI001EE3939A|nr:XylR N-terminal domain-containing protein [Mesobacterium pallidum]
MKISPDESALLARGGRPTLGDLLDRLKFSPTRGSITLNGARMLMTRATFGSDLRDQLVRRYGEHEAMILMLRLGYLSGREDAEFILQSWPELDPGDAFTAGTRLHMVTGTVRVETISNDFDFDADRFSGDFFWHDSVEAGEYHRRHGRALAPVCWVQTGYAAGYASPFFRKLVLFKETSCSAMGHKACRVVGKTVDDWGRDDPFVQLFLNEVLPTGGDMASAVRSGGRGAGRGDALDLDDLVIRPVRDRLDLVLRSGVPALVTGPAGAGCRAAARWLHRQRFRRGAFSIVHARSDELGERLTALRQQGAQGQSSEAYVAISAIEELPTERQWTLLNLISRDQGPPPQVIALSDMSPAQITGDGRLLPELAYALNVLPVALPPLSERAADLPELARVVLSSAPALRDAPRARLTEAATDRIARLDLPGNLPQLRTLLQRAALLATDPKAIDAPDIEAALAVDTARAPGRERTDPWILLAPAFANGTLTLDQLNETLVRGALEANGGNVAATARLLGLTRPQLAYRLRAATDKGTTAAGDPPR